MYSMSHPPPPINGGIGGAGIVDGSGTINPAALSAAPGAVAPPSSSGLPAPLPSPRGVKRSRSPDSHPSERVDDGSRMHADESKPRKRGRPPKVRPNDPVATPQHAPQPLSNPVQTPQSQTHSIPHSSPSHSSPTKTTPTKPAVLKALPTVRDHTTDQLNPEGDEYIPREKDEEGEKKVAPNGAPLDGRQYRCRTFYMPNRGDKLFMLATECAKVLSYRDSYLLFNKNRSLYKIIANQAEKNDLIQQDILPNSYRSRQIAIVTARSMFRQFGARLIVNGRRVRDDYWESKARKQGFTEDDAAGEKRPGGAKQREAAAAAEKEAMIINSDNINYIKAQNPMEGSPDTLAPLPVMNSMNYGAIPKPKHEITGPLYQDKSQPSLPTDILNYSSQAADFNKNLNQQRSSRGKYLDDYWRRSHEQTGSPGPLGGGEAGETTSSTVQAIQSPQMPTSSGPVGNQQSIAAQPSPAQPHLMTSQPYSQPMQHGIMAQSPVRPVHAQLPGSQIHRSPTLSMGSSTNPHHTQSYGYPTQSHQMWSQPQPSPLSQTPMQYGQAMQQQSPHMQHHSPAQLQQQSAGSSSMHGMGYPGGVHGHMSAGMSGGGMPGGMNPPAYNPRMYQSPNPQHFMQGSAAVSQPGMQGWAPAQHPSHAPGGQNWPGF